MELTQFNALILALAAMGFGIYLLIKSGDWIVDSAVFFAERFSIPPLVIGFTIVAFGTSLPELVVSVLANMQGSGGISIGNVLGSNIANIGLVIGLTAVFTVLRTAFKDVVKDLSFMLLATILITYLLVFLGDIGRVAGFAMIVVLMIYVYVQYKTADRNIVKLEEDEHHPEYSNAYEPYLFLFLGLGAIYIGAEALVRGAQVSATVIGVPEAVIALSVIALGTSLPELSTCLIAARKGHSDIVLGNIIGSNVFNILMIIGITALIKPITEGTFAQQLVDFDIWVMMAFSFVFAAVLLFYNKINRFLGVMFMGGYVAYNIYIYAMYVQ
jgi:cation:H+ antiporter